jgi:hypothetical protein
MSRKYSQADLNFWLASFVQRGRDHTPEWVTVSKLLRLGANPTVSPMGHRGMRLPSAIVTCQEMVEAYDPDHGRMLQGWRCSPAKAREICASTQKYFQGYLNQFARAGWTIPQPPRWIGGGPGQWCKACDAHIQDCTCEQPSKEDWGWTTTPGTR